MNFRLPNVSQLSSSARQKILGWVGALVVGAGPVTAGTDGFRNSLGMVFHAVKGTDVRFSIWETRVADWNAFLDSAGVKWEHRPDFAQDNSHPVVNVTLEEALAFCDWLTEKEHGSGMLKPAQSYRLPTNAEWDAAAGLKELTGGSAQVSATTPRRFLWGTDWPPPPSSGNYNTARIEGAESDGFAFTAPVGRFSSSADGIYDLGGNAWEWTFDPVAGDISSGTLRGSSWMYWRKECLEPAYRLTVAAETRVPGIGFRCVLEDSVGRTESESKMTAEKRVERDRLLSKAAVSGDEVKQAMLERTSRGKQLGSSNPGDPAMVEHGQSLVNSLGMKLLPLPGGGVLLGEHEVRAADYKAFVLAAGDSSKLGPQFRSEIDHPIVNVSWSEAMDFCRWLTRHERALGTISQSASYRLPSHAEWVLAASENDSAGERRTFPWGAAWPPPTRINSAASQGSGGGQPERKAVKAFPPNAIGFYELAGNAAEWCADAGGDLGSDRIYCGGSWKTTELGELRIDAEGRVEGGQALPDVGFRLVLDLGESDPVQKK